MEHHVILLPGWASGRQVWGDLPEKLSQKYITHKLNWEGIKYPEDFRSGVINYIQDNRLTDYTIIGWSLGALCALEAAFEPMDGLAGLILLAGCASFVRRSDPEYLCGWPAYVLDRMKEKLQVNKAAVLNEFQDSLFSGHEQKRSGNFYDDPMPEIRSLIAGLDYLKEVDLLKKINRITIPVLLVHGILDKIIPVKALKYLKDNLKGPVETFLLENTGHIPFLTQPEKVFAVIENFLSQRAGL